MKFKNDYLMSYLARAIERITVFLALTKS